MIVKNISRDRLPKIKRASVVEEMQEIFRLRHLVLAEQNKLYPWQKNKQIVDKFDYYGSSTNYIVRVNGACAATVRVMVKTNKGCFTDNFYDFSAITGKTAKMGCGSFLCIDKGFGGLNIVRLLMQQVIDWATSSKLTYILGVINPTMATIFKSYRYEILDDIRVDPFTKLPFLPAIKKMTVVP